MKDCKGSPLARSGGTAVGGGGESYIEASGASELVIPI